MSRGPLSGFQPNWAPTGIPADTDESQPEVPAWVVAVGEFGEGGGCRSWLDSKLSSRNCSGRRGPECECRTRSVVKGMSEDAGSQEDNVN